MTHQWLHTTHLKIHEFCGGFVRWVEAYDDPHTGFTGECLECGEEGIVVEEMLPFELPDGVHATEVYDQLAIEDLRGLHWDDDADFDENQQQFRELIDDVE